MDKIKFRQAKMDELKRVITLTKSAYKVPYKEGGLITTSNESADIKDLYKKKHFNIIVALSKNKITAAVRYKINDGQLYFYKLAVPKTHRRYGLGTKLIFEIEKIAKKKGCHKILLDCAREKKLPAYYKKFGFKIDRVKKHQDHHDVFMSKNIGGNK